MAIMFFLSGVLTIFPFLRTFDAIITTCDKNVKVGKNTGEDMEQEKRGERGKL